MQSIDKRIQGTGYCLTLVSLERVHFSAGGRLTENDVSIVSSCGGDHIYTRDKSAKLSDDLLLWLQATELILAPFRWWLHSIWGTTS